MHGVDGGMTVEATKKKWHYLQAVPLYLPSDEAAGRFFSKFRDEASAVTGTAITVLLPTPLANGELKAVEELFTVDLADPGKKKRYPGLKWADLPCLWLEDDQGGTAIISLKQDITDVSRQVRLLRDAAGERETAQAVKQRMDELLVQEAAVTPWMKAQKEVQLQPATEKLIALICGVVFVAVILVIALFVPKPEPFQVAVFRIVLSIAAAGFVSMTPGFINLKLGGWLQAGGALAVFAIVFFFNPVSLVAPTSP